MLDYLPRVSDELLKLKIESKGAVLIEGAKWCGKTTTPICKKRAFYAAAGE